MADRYDCGSFTMPGESGYEDLTLALAKKWGADVIRDSDGTTLSKALLASGMDVYSTICIIREHNAFINAHPQYQQQVFLESERLSATSDTVSLPLLTSYFPKQFQVNRESVSYWQVFDRTTGKEVPPSQWTYDDSLDCVVVHNARLWHQYSVDFLAYRIWEEINMYNHVTNKWEKEPLKQLDVRYPEVQQYLRSWLTTWCEQHPDTDVVRFTSLFYNFVWIWGSDERNPFLFTDWASYDFTVSPLALEQFADEYGYRLTGEDFINNGYRNPNHIVWKPKMVDYLWFTNRFVCSFAKQLVDIVHAYGKKAYVFYDDSWVGMEPQTDAFTSIGFDGIIKCVFSGFEAQLCHAVKGVETHELRLHPYLFPVGLSGAPTFATGGHPEVDANRYWVQVRRALLRAPVDRIGVGGLLHLVEGFPAFVDTIADIARQFRVLKELHERSRVHTEKFRIGILTSWGKLRTWTCGGHYHEHPELDLINILESLSGLPYEVAFLSFEDVTSKRLSECDVIVNAGFALSSWSGGDHWKSDKVVEALTAWVYDGGTFLGVNEPSALEGYAYNLRLAPVLGVDVDDGRLLCHGRWKVEETSIPYPFKLRAKQGVWLLDGDTELLQSVDGVPAVTRRRFGKGQGLYLCEYRYSNENTLALRSLLEESRRYSSVVASNNPWVDCAWFPSLGKVVLANSSDRRQHVVVTMSGTSHTMEVDPYALVVVDR